MATKYPADSTTDSIVNGPNTNSHKDRPPDVKDNNTRLKLLEFKVDSLVTGQAKMVKLLETLLASNKHGVGSPKRRSLTSPRPKTKARPPSVTDMSRLLHLPYALQENMRMFTKDLIFTKETELPDKLLEKECLSEDDYERICSKPTNVDQVRMLIRKIKDKGPGVIDMFLDVLDDSGMYAHLAQKVRDTTAKIDQEHKGIPACVFCVMQAYVDIKDIVDDLWEERIISDEMHGQIVEGDDIYKYRSAFWSEVTDHCNATLENKVKSLNVLTNALKLNNYSYIVEYLEKIPQESKFSCCCCKRRGLRPRPPESFYQSDSEYSATCTSCRGAQNLPSRDLLNSTDIESEQSDVNSFERSDCPKNADIRMSFDLTSLNRFDSIGSLRQQGSIESPRDLESLRDRHVSGDFVPQDQVTQSETDENLRSLQYLNHELLPHLSPTPENRDKPDFSRSTSRVSTATTIKDANTDSNTSPDGNETGEKQLPTSDSGNTSHSLDDNNDGEVSQQDKTNELNLTDNDRVNDNANKETVEETKTNAVEHETTNDASSGKPFQINLRRPRLESDKDCFADAEDDYEKHTAKGKRNRFRGRKLILERKCTPFTGGSFVTDSKQPVDNAQTKLAAPKTLPRSSKRSRKRLLRRQRSQQESDGGTNPLSPSTVNARNLTRDNSDDKGLKQPYNPLKGKVPQPKLVPKWDYNQSRRHRQMAQFLVVSNNELSLPSAKSDTDFRTITDDSDIFTYSDYTV